MTNLISRQQLTNIAQVYFDLDLAETNLGPEEAVRDFVDFVGKQRSDKSDPTGFTMDMIAEASIRYFMRPASEGGDDLDEEQTVRDFVKYLEGTSL